ncbi:MAG: NADH-quinone oxidoreductase subunit NuoK [Candidatus Dormiibacterota bacterium]|nr:NADH-quinone oxidoreductase subunit NuoK [Candidatus Dormibacteraeota bacterium]HEV3233842.1 NADH-quinone oxidoreductase subunit NuoK [Candidatus Dormibacteraeota bacterium]
MTYIGLGHFLVVSAGLFAIGVYGLLSKRNAISLLISVEIMFNSVSLALAAFARFGYNEVQPLAGQAFALFIIAIAAGEVAVAIAILLVIYRQRATVWVDEIDLMKW